MSQIIGLVRSSRFPGNEIVSAAAAIKAAPPGYARMKKRIALFGRQVPIEALIPSSTDVFLANNTDRIRLAAIYTEAGLLTKAVDTLTRAGRYKTRYLQLTKAAAAFSDTFAARYRADLEALNFLEQYEDSFARLILANKGSICVVGNSPCDIGRGLGPAIDDHAVVIRFNNFSTSPEHAQDYGTKCDVWCRSPSYRHVNRRSTFKPSLTIAVAPLQWRIENGQDMPIEYMGQNDPLDVAPVELVTATAVRCGAPPSSGLLTLAWIESILGGLDGVSSCGFALTDQENGLKHYFKNPERKKAPPHDWGREREVLNQMLTSLRKL
jgi:hypothetical protein